MYNSDWLPAYSLLTQEDAFETYDAPDDEVQEEDLEAFKMPEADAIELEAVEVIAVAGAPSEEALPEPEGSEAPKSHHEQPLIQPLYTEDYFRHQGVAIADEAAHIAPNEIQSRKR